jgi:hypothetical protein
VKVVLGCWGNWRKAPAEPGTVYVDFLNASIRRDGVIVHLMRHRFRLAALLLASGDRPLSRDEIIAILYGDRADGGPDGAEKLRDVVITHLRKPLAGLDLRVVAHWRVGHCVVDTREHPVPTPASLPSVLGRTLPAVHLANKRKARDAALSHQLK